MFIYYYGNTAAIDGELYLYTDTCRHRRKRSMVGISSLLAAAGMGGTGKQVTLVVDSITPFDNITLTVTRDRTCVLVRRARNYLSTFDGADLFTGAFAHMLRKSLSILPCISIENVLKMVSTVTGRLYTDDFLLFGDPQVLRQTVLQGDPDSTLWRIDPDNFGSVNSGSREDGLQQLREALTDSKLRSDAEFLIRYSAELDPASNVRLAARALLEQTRSKLWLHPRNVGREELLRLIPDWVEIASGSFLMGSDPRFDVHALPEEMPQHEMFLDTFAIAKRQVSRYQFGIYLYAIGSTIRRPVLSENQMPCSGVSWYDAMNYGRWLTDVASSEGLIEPDARLTLPSEAEWEKAARGLSGRLYPWGNKFKPNRCNCREEGIGEIVKFGCFSPKGDSPFGVEDMSGNVWEWTRSNWGKGGRTPEYRYPYAPDDGRENIEAPADVRRVIRGGAFYYFDYCVRCATRNVMFPDTHHSGGGFRLIKRPKQLAGIG